MAKLSPNEAQLTDWLSAQKYAMLELIGELVNIDSGSYDKAGVEAVGRRLVRFFEENGLIVAIEPHETFAPAIHVRLDATRSNEKPIVLMGHRDTVFPKGEAVRRPFRVENGRAYGPGVSDMKAGLVMNAFVLAAVKRFGGAPAPVVGLITSDEEIASPSSRPIIERVARAARCLFNAEPGRPSGNIVTGRKGGVFLRFEVFGRAAHSGGAFEKGISAIGELAHKVVAMHKVTDMARGVTVNVGIVAGGRSVNTTAPHAEGQIDLRYVNRRIGHARSPVCKRSSTQPSFPVARRGSRSSASFCRSPRRVRHKSCLRATRPPPPMPAFASRANFRAAAPIRALAPGSAVRRCARPDRSEATRTRRKSTWRLPPWCRVHRP